MLSIAAAVVAGFFATLALAPQLPYLHLHDPRILSALHVETPRHHRGPPAWTRIPKPKKGQAGTATKPLTVAFYVSWTSARASRWARTSASSTCWPRCGWG